MKRPPKKKKVPGYLEGGDVVQQATIEPDKMKVDYQKGNFKNYAHDALVAGGQYMLSPLGLENTLEGQYRTEKGAKAGQIIDKYYAPITRGVTSAALNIVAPGLGTAYSMGAKAADSSITKNKEQMKEGETEAEYYDRMVNSGIDPKMNQKQGLQGQEGTVAGLTNMAIQYGSMAFKNGGEVDSFVDMANNDFLRERIQKIGRVAAMKEYNDFFADEE